MSVDNIMGHPNDGQVEITDGAGNSAVMPRFLGDVKVTGYARGGSESAVGEAQGAVVGLRKGKREYPEITLSRIAAKRGDTFMNTLCGQLSGSVSTTDDIGDVHTVDFDLQDSFRASSRSIQADDCECTAVEFSQSDPHNVESITLRVLGRFVLDGVVYITGRDPLA